MQKNRHQRRFFISLFNYYFTLCMRVIEDKLAAFGNENIAGKRIFNAYNGGGYGCFHFGFFKGKAAICHLQLISFKPLQ